jgi:predicted RecA/RadA family phage recombinase
MAKNFVQESATLTLAAPDGGCVSGQPYQYGALNGVFLSSAAEGEEVAFVTEGVFELVKEDGLGLFIGEIVYLEDGEITDSGSGFGFGICVSNADSTDPTVRVKLYTPGPAGPEGPPGPPAPII